MEILYSDRELAVCVKPVGLDSETAVPAALIQQLGGEIYPVHRLDQNVGGVMVYARSRAAAALLSGAIRDGTMVKEYVAQVHGTPPEAGDWTDLLLKDPRRNKVFVVDRLRGGVKEARLTFQRLEAADLSTVHIRLYTGRSHQIRVQFASRGFPLAGDHKYGARDALTAPQLFSCRITFPFRGKILQYTALPPWVKALPPIDK